jgi:alanyl-tRNA synthetase
MNATVRLYHQDPLLLRFTGRVISHETWQDRPSAILDRTAFYPEAGGQMADRGKLAGAAVLDVQVGDDGRVHHVLEGALPPLGADVEGEVEKERRRVHMALHTGQHMLSRALADVALAATVSSRLGETACTIDVDQEVVEERRIAAAEDLVNSIIDDDVPVRAFFPTAEELAALPLRRRPTVSENIRVVAVGEFDVSPCGGTHCTRSAQVGLVHVTGVERYKGKLRISFAAGARARRDLGAQAVTLRALGRDLSCDALLVPQGLARLREELAGSRDALGKMRGRLAEAIASGLGSAAAPGAPIVLAIDDAHAELLRSIATRLTADPSALVVLGGRTPEGVNILVTRGTSSTVDCGALLKRIAAAAGGRGGGRKEHAEGKLPAGADFDAAVRTALE